MKKILFAILLLIPFLVYAENCEVVTGTGKDIGDEIKCGTENFYLIEYNGTQTKMVAKYNLFVGDQIDYIAIEDPEEVETDMNFTIDIYSETCNELAEENGYHAYFTYPMLDYRHESTSPYKNFHTLKGCRVYEKIEYDHIRQDARAVGTVIKNGKSVLPLYGITYMVPEWGYEAIVNNEIHNNIYDNSGNLIVAGSSFEDYIIGYKEELESQNINVKKVEFFKLNYVIELLEELNDEEIEIKLNYDDAFAAHNNYDETSSREDWIKGFIGKMDIKDLAKGNDWLFSTTYWLGSGFQIYPGPDNWEIQPNPSEYNDYYISNEGILCALGRGQCGYFDYPIGNGIRPVITVKNENITYTLGDSASQYKPTVNPNTKAGFALIFIALAAGALSTCFIVKKKELN